MRGRSFCPHQHEVGHKRYYGPRDERDEATDQPLEAVHGPGRHQGIGYQPNPTSDGPGDQQTRRCRPFKQDGHDEGGQKDRGGRREEPGEPLRLERFRYDSEENDHESSSQELPQVIRNFHRLAPTVKHPTQIWSVYHLGNYQRVWSLLRTSENSPSETV